MAPKTKTAVTAKRRDTKSTLLYTLTLGVFLFLAAWIKIAGSLPFDIPLMTWLHAHAALSLDLFFRSITNFGGAEGAVILVGVAGVILLLKKSYSRLTFVLAGMAGTLVINTILKALFHRDRPSLWPHLVDEAGYSFPSGHAMASMSLALICIVLSWQTRYRWWVVVVAAVFVITIGVSRLYLGVHYPSDIITGWCVSTVWIVVAALLVRPLSKKIASPHK